VKGLLVRRSWIQIFCVQVLWLLVVGEDFRSLSLDATLFLSSAMRRSRHGSDGKDFEVGWRLWGCIVSKNWHTKILDLQSVRASLESKRLPAFIGLEHFAKGLGRQAHGAIGKDQCLNASSVSLALDENSRRACLKREDIFLAWTGSDRLQQTGQIGYGDCELHCKYVIMPPINLEVSRSKQRNCNSTAVPQDSGRSAVSPMAMLNV
jgi:hypothetical protein